MNFAELKKKNGILFYVVDFIEKIEKHWKFFLGAILVLTIAMIVKNPIFYSFFLGGGGAEVHYFLKNNFFLISLIYLLSELTVVLALFYFYISIDPNGKNKTFTQNALIFVGSVISGNIGTVIFAGFFSLIAWGILSLFLTNQKEVILVVFLIFIISVLLFLYIFPYYYAKALFEAKNLKESFLKFFAFLNFKKSFALFKNKEYFVLMFKSSVGLFLIFILLFAIVLILNIVLLTTKNISLFKFLFIANIFFTSVIYIFVAYTTIYIGYVVYRDFLKKKTDKPVDVRNN